MLLELALLAVREVLREHVCALAEADPAELAGGDAAHNAAVARRVLAGEPGAVRSAVLMEAGVALTAAGLADDFAAGAARAAAAIDRGAAAATLERLVATSAWTG